MHLQLQIGVKYWYVYLKSYYSHEHALFSLKKGDTFHLSEPFLSSLSYCFTLHKVVLTSLYSKIAYSSAEVCCLLIETCYAKPFRLALKSSSKYFS